MTRPEELGTLDDVTVGLSPKDRVRVDANEEETLYLLRSPANARHLAESIAEAEAGRTEPHELIEVDDSELPGMREA